MNMPKFSEGELVLYYNPRCEHHLEKFHVISVRYFRMIVIDSGLYTGWGYELVPGHGVPEQYLRRIDGPGKDFHTLINELSEGITDDLSI